MIPSPYVVVEVFAGGKTSVISSHDGFDDALRAVRRLNLTNPNHRVRDASGEYVAGRPNSTG